MRVRASCFSHMQSESWLAEEADLLQLQREHVKSREVHLEEREKRYLEVVAQLDRDVSGGGGDGAAVCVCVCLCVRACVSVCMHTYVRILYVNVFHIQNSGGIATMVFMYIEARV